MENTQQPDQYSTPLPQGATVGQGQDQYSTPLPQGATVGQMQPTQPQNDEIHSNSDDSSLTKVGKGIGGAFEGVGEGVFGTLAGGADIVDKVTGQKPGTATDELHKLAGDNNQEHGTAQSIGRGIETIGEFLMGDAALKGLSVSEKLAKVTPILKYLESSPKLARTLALGINVGKAGAELGPEERAAIQKSPILARLVGAGLDAVRAGTVQGVQTGIKSGGDVKKAATDAAGMAAGAGITGGVLGTAGGLLSKAGDAADVVSATRDAAQAAPTSNEVNSGLDTAVKTAGQPAIDAAQSAQQDAQGKIDSAAAVPEAFAANAPSNEAITSSTQKAVKNAHQMLMDEYGHGLDVLRSVTKDQTVPYKESPLQLAAKNLLGKASDESHPLDAALEKSRPGSDKANEMVQRLADPYMDENEEIQKNIASAKKKGLQGPALTPKTLDTHPIDMDIDKLVDTRKTLGERLRNTGWQTDEQRADRDVYKKLIQGTDDSIEQLVGKSGNPHAIDVLNDMNSSYKSGIRRFDNTDVKALLQGNSNDVAKRLMGGGTSVADINTVRDTIGKDAFKKLADDSVQRMAADAVDKTTGQFNFDGFFKKWNNIPPDVRSEMFRESVKGGSVQNAIMQVQKTNASGVIPESAAAIKEATDSMADVLGNGDMSSLLKDPERVQNLATMVGPKAMTELGQSVLQNQLKEASTDATGKLGNVDAGKFLDFAKSLKDSPEVVDAMFRPTPEASKAYDKLISDMQNVQSVKTMVKLGIIAPTLAAGGVAGHFMGSALLGAFAAGSGDFAAKSLLEKLANSPKTWSALKALDTVAKTPEASGAGIVSKYLAGKTAGTVSNALRTAMQSTQSQLSQ